MNWNNCKEVWKTGKSWFKCPFSWYWSHGYLSSLLSFFSLCYKHVPVTPCIFCFEGISWDVLVQEVFVLLQSCLYHELMITVLYWQIRETLKGFNKILERVAHLMPPDVHRLLEREAQRVNSTVLMNRRAYADLISNLLSGKSGKLINPFTQSSGQSKISRKILTFTFSNSARQIVPSESTAEEVSFEWSHHRISSTDSKVRTTLNVSTTDSGTERVNIINN